MVLYDLDLCGTKATGLIFRFFGIRSLMSPHFTTLAYPLFTLSATSAWRKAAASGDVAAVCGPRLIASTICVRVHAFPQSAGQPCRPHSSSMGAVECEVAKERGYIVLPIASLAGEGIVSSLSKVEAIVDDSFSGDSARRDGGKGTWFLSFVFCAGR